LGKINASWRTRGKSALGGGALVFSGKPAKFRTLATSLIKVSIWCESKGEKEIRAAQKLMKV
jgi:hypothetical protein